VGITPDQAEETVRSYQTLGFAFREAPLAEPSSAYRWSSSPTQATTVRLNSIKAPSHESMLDFAYMGSSTFDPVKHDISFKSISLLATAHLPAQ
jgi:hypothetical protein